MVFAWNRREIILYDIGTEVELISETSPAAMKDAINVLLQAGWILDPVISQLSTVVFGSTVTYSILLVRELPVP
jgi:hypothetical protein